MTKDFKWGILAPGRIAGKFAEDIGKLPGHCIYAVGSRSLERAGLFAERYNIPNAYGSYEELLRVGGIDALYIASPHSGHFEHTLQCIDAGIPVLCEKPLAINSLQVSFMIARAKQRNVFLMEALWTRFLPAMEQALSWIEMGKIGDIQGVKADFGFKPTNMDPSGRLFNPALGGGALLDIGIYPIFLALLVMGKPSKIQARGVIGATGVDEEVILLTEHGADRFGQLHASIRNDTKTEGFIFGSKGVIHLHTRWHETTSLAFLPHGEVPEILHFDNQGWGYGWEAKEVERCVTQGLLESPKWSLEQSLLLMEIMDEVRLQIGLNYPDLE
jgi:predicted dehydrogenase